MQTTGDLVSYDTTNTLAKHTSTANIGTGPYSLVMADDGHAYIYQGNGAAIYTA
jgi:hypothetical protein